LREGEGEGGRRKLSSLKEGRKKPDEEKGRKLRDKGEEIFIERGEKGRPPRGGKKKKPVGEGGRFSFGVGKRPVFQRKEKLSYVKKGG